MAITQWPPADGHGFPVGQERKVSGPAGKLGGDRVSDQASREVSRTRRGLNVWPFCYTAQENASCSSQCQTDNRMRGGRDYWIVIDIENPMRRMGPLRHESVGRHHGAGDGVVA